MLILHINSIILFNLTIKNQIIMLRDTLKLLLLYSNQMLSLENFLSLFFIFFFEKKIYFP